MNERAAPLFFVKGGANSFAAAANLFPTGERIIILINSTDTAAAAARQSCNAGREGRGGGGGLPFFRSFLSSLPLPLLSLSRRLQVLLLLPSAPPSLFVGECRCRIVSVPENVVAPPSIYRAEKRIKVKLLRLKFQTFLQSTKFSRFLARTIRVFHEFLGDPARCDNRRRKPLSLMSSSFVPLRLSDLPLFVRLLIGAVRSYPKSNNDDDGEGN